MLFQIEKSLQIAILLELHMVFFGETHRKKKKTVISIGAHLTLLKSCFLNHINNKNKLILFLVSQ